MNKLENKLLLLADREKDELFDLLSELLRFDSQNFITSGREKDCAEYIQRLYEQLGLETELYTPDSVPKIKEHPGYLPGRGTENRSNVSGILVGQGGSRVMLAAHIDTMPVGDRSKWTVDPFGGEIIEGRIYGLGAGDNKSGIAAAYYAIKILRKCGVQLNDDVVLTSYVDEEYGGGNGALAACLKYPCETYVNLDGGNFEIWTAAIGGRGFEIKVKADFPTDTLVPVIEALYLIKQELCRFGAQRAKELHDNPLYSGSDMERSAIRLLEMNCGSFGSNLDEGKIKFVFYTDKTENQIATELNCLMDQIQSGLMRQRIHVYDFQPITRFFTYMEATDLYGAIKTLKQAAQDIRGQVIKESGACLSDLSIFLPYGSKSSLSFGISRDFALPGGAHQPDEYVTCEQLLAYAKSLMLFLVRHCHTSLLHATSD